jgi:hypothetical protein
MIGKRISENTFDLSHEHVRAEIEETKRLIQIQQRASHTGEASRPHRGIENLA